MQYLCSKNRLIHMIEHAYLDWSFEQDKFHNYKFVIVGDKEHSILPTNRVKLGVIGRPDYQYGTVLDLENGTLIIHTEEWLDISEEYSIELCDDSFEH